MTLLPPNASPLELALESALTAEQLPVQLREIWTPLTCPEALLPWLAWALSVDGWSPDWPLLVRRQVVARAIAIQREKGTLSAIRNAVAAFGAAVEIKEWWQLDPAGTPGTFQLVLALGAAAGSPPTSDFIDDVIDQVTRNKPLSRSFTFTISAEASGQVGIGAFARVASFVRLQMAA